MLASQLSEQSAAATEFEQKKGPKSIQIIAVTTQSTSATRRDLQTAQLLFIFACRVQWQCRCVVLKEEHRALPRPSTNSWELKNKLVAHNLHLPQQS